MFDFYQRIAVDLYARLKDFQMGAESYIYEKLLAFYS